MQACRWMSPPFSDHPQLVTFHQRCSLQTFSPALLKAIPSYKWLKLGTEMPQSRAYWCLQQRSATSPTEDSCIRPGANGNLTDYADHLHNLTSFFSGNQNGSNTRVTYPRARRFSRSLHCRLKTIPVSAKERLHVVLHLQVLAIYSLKGCNFAGIKMKTVTNLYYKNQVTHAQHGLLSIFSSRAIKPQFSDIWFLVNRLILKLYFLLLIGGHDKNFQTNLKFLSHSVVLLWAWVCLYLTLVLNSVTSRLLQFSLSFSSPR